MMNILVTNLPTNFQDLVAKVKNVVTLAPVLGAISRPARMFNHLPMLYGRQYHLLNCFKTLNVGWIWSLKP